ncbi:MAG: SDR family NAD(P)-dependent oxidoreductase, partial [Ginsengibacter sp.]
TEVNVNGAAEIISYAFNYFINQGFGHIACISSVASIKGNAYAPAYSASKAWQSNYMEGLYFKAKKLKSNIAVTDIQPGFVDTAMAKGNRKFWVATPQKAAQQIYTAILNKKKVVYVTKRWWWFATLLKCIPDCIYKKMSS